MEGGWREPECRRHWGRKPDALQEPTPVVQYLKRLSVRMLRLISAFPGQHSDDVVGSHTEASGWLSPKFGEFEPDVAGRREAAATADCWSRFASRDHRALYQNDSQRRESLGNSDLRSVGVLSNIIIS